MKNMNKPTLDTKNVHGFEQIWHQQEQV